MKKAILLCGMLLAVSATVASAAAGVNIRWQLCFGDAGAINRTFACNTNSGSSNVLAASFVLPADLPQGAAVGVHIDLATASATLPDWWQFTNTGACRQTALSAAAQDGAGCPDWAQGQASVSIAGYNVGAVGGPNTADINIANAVSLDLVQDLFAGQEYGVVKLTISNAKTVGTPSCAGCLVPACIVNQNVDMFSAVNNGALHILMAGPTNGTDSNYCLWQGGAGIQVGNRIGCPAAVPTHKSTWGAVKSLYR
jgi:hypothetical protein